MLDRAKEADLATSAFVCHSNGNGVFVDVQSHVKRLRHWSFSFELFRVRQKNTLAALAPPSAHLV
jgi:hypothetical protein